MTVAGHAGQSGVQDLVGGKGGGTGHARILDHRF
jgi:hypothetical protein